MFCWKRALASVVVFWQWKQDKVAKQQDKGKGIMTMRRNALFKHRHNRCVVHK